jgi:cell wall-associated NlpC family hydrolase
VFGTGGEGVWLKADSRLDSDRIILLPEGTALHLVQGPLRAGNDLWWARIEVGGQEGWMVADYLLMDTTPAPAAPATTPTALNVGDWAKVINTYTTTGLRLRADAAPWADLLAIIPEGALVQVVGAPKAGGNGNPWYQIASEGNVGWSDGTYLELAVAPTGGTAPAPRAAPVPTTTPTTAGLTAGMWATVTDTTGTTGLRLRAAPAPWEQLIAIIPEGTTLKLLEGPANGGNGNAWYRVAWDTSWGWVDSTYLAASSAPTGNSATGGTANSNALVQVALAQVGKKYVWGATGPDTFDCSGLTVYVARKALGITLPRVAADQARAGVHVDEADLVPGDLLFYENTYQPGITHVGVYIGNRRWVDAANESTGVIVSGMDEAYWKSRYVGARRIT